MPNMTTPKYDCPPEQFTEYALTEYENDNVITHVPLPVVFKNAPAGTTTLDAVGPAVKL